MAGIRVRADFTDAVALLDAAGDPNSDANRRDFEIMTRKIERDNNVDISREMGRVPHVNIINGKRSEPYYGVTKRFPQSIDWRVGVRYNWASNVAIARDAMRLFRQIAPYDSSDSVHYRDSFYMWNAKTNDFFRHTPNRKYDPLDTLRIMNILPYARRLDRFGDRPARGMVEGPFYIVQAAMRKRYSRLADIRVEFPRQNFWVRGQGSYMQAETPGPVQQPVLAIYPRV